MPQVNTSEVAYINVRLCAPFGSSRQSDWVTPTRNGIDSTSISAQSVNVATSLRADGDEILSTLRAASSTGFVAVQRGELGAGHETMASPRPPARTTPSSNVKVFLGG